MRRFQNYFGGVAPNVLVFIRIVNAGAHFALGNHVWVVFLGSLRRQSICQQSIRQWLRSARERRNHRPLELRNRRCDCHLMFLKEITLENRLGQIRQVIPGTALSKPGAWLSFERSHGSVVVFDDRHSQVETLSWGCHLQLAPFRKEFPSPPFLTTLHEHPEVSFVIKNLGGKQIKVFGGAARLHQLFYHIATLIIQISPFHFLTKAAHRRSVHLVGFLHGYVHFIFINTEKIINKIKIVFYLQ